MGLKHPPKTQKALFRAFFLFFLFTSFLKVPYDEGALEAETFLTDNVLIGTGLIKQPKEQSQWLIV